MPNRIVVRAWCAASLLAAMVTAGAPRAATGAPLARKDVPSPLAPWVDWVLRGHEDELCPFLDGHDGDGRTCAWPARLDLALDERGGRFTQIWRLHKEEWVPLPGDDKRWPLDVKLDGKPAVAAPQDGTPSVLLPAGDHRVSGTFAWDSLPDELRVPPETGLLSLTVRGKRIDFPSRDGDGNLWLQRRSEGNLEEERLEIRVHRKLIDDVPLLLATRIHLRVAGKSREILLGRVLPDGFVPMSLAAPLPARLEPDGKLRAQVRAGDWVIEVGARHDGPASRVARPDPAGPWAPGDEVWVFEAVPRLRVVTVEGVPAIDPQQTTLGDDWKRLPAYLMKAGAAMALTERQRGDANPAPDALTLSRDLWLDFDGGGFTASDRISGRLTRSWRLDAAPALALGRVAVGGRDQFITRAPDGQGAGVEVRQGTADVRADLRLHGGHGSLPATGWRTDFHGVSAALHLPPGWRLVHASGADDVPGTWIARWTLLDLFLVLVTALAAGRLFGKRWGVLALVALALTVPESDSPRWVWLGALGAEALVRLVPAGRWNAVMRWLRLGAWVVLVVNLLPFATQHLRRAMYPALEQPYGDVARFAKHPEQMKEGRMGARMPAEPAAAAAPASPASIAERRARVDAEAKRSGILGMLGDKSGSVADVLGSVGGAEMSEAAGVGDGIGGAGGHPGKKAKAAPKRASVPVSAPPSLYGLAGPRVQVAQNAAVYDPNAMVQTGPGVPTWDWYTVPIRFHGPVEAGQRLSLLLVPPAGNLALALLRIGLLAALLVRLLASGGRGLALVLGAAAPAAAFLLAFAPGVARADWPPDEVLDELRSRLLERPECLPSCASIPRLSLEARGAMLRGRLEVGAQALTAIPLPGAADQWAPTTVLLDGKTAPSLVRTSDGALWLEVRPGAHTVLIEGPLPARDTVEVHLPLRPRHVEARAEGWTVEGLHEDGLADESLQLSRKQRGEKDEKAALAPGSLPPFVRVERTLSLGLTWQVVTHVVRMTPPGAAVVIEVPLLPGESVTTQDVRVAGGRVLVNLPAQTGESTWTSTLAETPALRLLAPKDIAWTEVWRVDASPIWHVAATGLPPAQTPPGVSERVPEWRPWPGERLLLALARPEGIAGRTLTIDAASLSVKPGVRATDVTLSVTVRASRGGEHVVTLPPGAELESLAVNGVAQPLRREGDGRRVTVPVAPGTQLASLTFREPRGIGARFVTPAPDIGAAGVNTAIDVAVPDGRWVLLVGGPRLGPAVVFWSALVVILLAALALGRVRITPLRAHHWMLLGVGLAQIPAGAIAVVAGWLLALGLRRSSGGPRPRAVFNLTQVLLVVWTLVALILIGVTIEEGLLRAPDMQIAGNGSSATSLRWFADRAPGTLPTAWVLSVPILVYRLAMLAWALWLAIALLRWLRWGWGSFTSGGTWRRSPPKPPKPPAPAAPEPAPATPPGYT